MWHLVSAGNFWLAFGETLYIVLQQWIVVVQLFSQVLRAHLYSFPKSQRVSSKISELLSWPMLCMFFCKLELVDKSHKHNKRSFFFFCVPYVMPVKAKGKSLTRSKVRTAVSILVKYMHECPSHSLCRVLSQAFVAATTLQRARPHKEYRTEISGTYILAAIGSTMHLHCKPFWNVFLKRMSTNQ